MTVAAKRLRVLNFHGIGPPVRAFDPGEADYWIGVERFRSVLDRIAGHPDQEHLSITFDDGNISDLTIAAPELQRRGLTAKFFVLTGRVGETGSLARDDVRTLMSGGMGIGSHGIAHRDWASLSTSDLDDELSRSKSMLEEICGEAVRFAAIPFGRYNATVLAALRTAGYAAAYSSDGGCMDAAAFVQPRTSIRHDMTDLALDQILSGRLPPARRLRRAISMSVKRWF